MEDESHLIPVKADVLNQKPYVARISRYLFETLTNADGGTFRAVLDAMDQMEQLPNARPVRTKAASQFKGPVLWPLHKFHYTTTSFMGQNILLNWNSKGNRKQRDELNSLFEKTMRSYQSLDEAWEVAGKIACKIVDGYKDRGSSQQLTGEWVIYQEWNGQNYYLALATHSEAKYDEKALFDRIKTGCPEFSFCFP